MTEAWFPSEGFWWHIRQWRSCLSGWAAPWKVYENRWKDETEGLSITLLAFFVWFHPLANTFQVSFARLIWCLSRSMALHSHQIVPIPIIEFEMNAADSDSQQSRQGKSAYIYPMISQEFTQAWFISVLKRQLFGPPAPIRIPLSITNGRYSFLTKVGFRRGGSLHPQQLTSTDPEPYGERGHRTSNFRSGGKLWTASCAFQSIWAEILRRGEVKTKTIAMIAMDYCIVDQN